MLSIANAVWVWPTERHHSTVIGVLGECSETRLDFVPSRYGESATPSTDVASTPFLNHELLERRAGEDRLPDDDVMPRLRHAGLASRPTWTRWTNAGR